MKIVAFHGSLVCRVKRGEDSLLDRGIKCNTGREIDRLEVDDKVVWTAEKDEEGRKEVVKVHREGDRTSLGYVWPGDLVEVGMDTVWKAPKERYHPERRGEVFVSEVGDKDLYQTKNPVSFGESGYQVARLYRASYK